MKAQPASAKSAAVFAARAVANLSNAPQRAGQGVPSTTTTIFTIIARH